jgi:CubicO group peptidase (beta-lactamase class C family)
MRSSLIDVVGMALAAGNAVAQVPVGPPPALAGLEQAALHDMQNLLIPGISLAVVDSGRLVHSRGVGVANTGSGAPVTTDMLFRVGSMTKMITAMATLTLAQERGIPLDAPVGRYVSGLAPRIGQLTLAQLLSHSAGLREVVVAFPLDDDRTEADLLREVRSWGDTLLFTEPGDVMSYANLGYVLLGAFVESVSGKRYADFVEERVLHPLGITDAGFRVQDVLRHPHADGYVGAPRRPAEALPAVKTDARHWPAGFLWATPNDYARVAIALMNHGMIDGRQAIPRSVVDAMTTPRVPVPGDSSAAYGYGLVVLRNRVAPVWTHNGRLAGFGSDIWLSPATGRAVIVLRNRMDASPPETIALLQTWALPPATVPPPGAGPRPEIALAGTYGNGADTLVVRTAAGAMTLTHGPRAGPLTARVTGDYAFAWTDSATGATGTSTFRVVPDQAGGTRYLADRLLAYRRLP